MIAFLQNGSWLTYMWLVTHNNCITVDCITVGSAFFVTFLASY